MHAGRHFGRVTETSPPEVNDAALSVPSFLQGCAGMRTAPGGRGRDAVPHLRPEPVCGRFTRLLSQLEAMSDAA